MKKTKELGLLQIFSHAELSFLSIGIDADGRKLLKEQLKHEEKRARKKNNRKNKI